MGALHVITTDPALGEFNRLMGKSTVCVDFNLGRLTALELSGRRVVRWVEDEMSTVEERHGDPIEPRRLGWYLKAALEQNHIQAKKARLAISDEATVTRVVDVPRMPRRHLVQAMEFLIEKELPFPPGKALASWDIIHDDGASIRICMAAAWQDVVERFVEVADRAGLEAEVVEPRSIAIQRALKLQRALILDAGPYEVNLTLLTEGRPPFTDHLVCSRDVRERERSLRQLLERVVVNNQNLGEVPVLIAGELEGVDLRLPMPTTDASTILNGHPVRPDTLPSGRFLSNLGLALR